MHRQLSEKGIEVLKGLDETSRVVLYGSVSRGDFRSDSDIDIALICFDGLRGLPLDEEGLPIGLRRRVNESLEKIPNPGNVKFHVPIYWESEFEKGIELFSEGRSPPDLLHKVGIVKYCASDAA